MVQPVNLGLDTPRTNLGDPDYLDRQPDLDMTDEPSFQSPGKEPNVFQSMRNGTGRPSLRTPRVTNNSRAPFGDRINMPNGIGGAEFTPLLKSATRNSVRRRGGKENGLTTPALGKVEEERTPIQAGESSMFKSPRDRTPLPEADSDSTASTPMIMRRGKHSDRGPLHDGQQLSLREQEGVIDRIEKENFGLKLKIHFLEQALQKSGPSFNEAALRENTELKVDKITTQKELQRYKKHLNSAEKELESYRKQLQAMQEAAKYGQGAGEHSVELDRLRRDMKDKDADIEGLQQQLRADRQDLDQLEKLQDEIGDLEAEIREKERMISDRDDELDEIKAKARQTGNQSQDEVDKLRDEIDDLQADIREKEQFISERDDELKDLRLRLRQTGTQSQEEVGRLRIEIENLQAEIREKEGLIKERDGKLNELKIRVRQTGSQSQAEVGKLRDEVDDLQADIRTKDIAISEHEHNLQKLQSRVQQAEDKAKKAQIRMIELEEKAQASGKLKEAKETIQDLEATVRDLENQAVDLRDRLEDAQADKERAETDLEELQEEMANKSVVTKGLPRQLEEKVIRLQDEVEAARHDYKSLEQQFNSKQREVDDLKFKLKESRHERDASEGQRRAIAAKFEELQSDLSSRGDEKHLLQSRHDALTAESASLQRDIVRLQKTVTDLQSEVERERQHAMDNERQIRMQHRVETERLNNEISELQAELRERENMYDNDSEKWATERHTLEAERRRAEERVLGLQRTIEKLRAAEGSLNNKESRLQEALQSETERHHNEEAVLSRQIDDLQDDLSSRQHMLENLRNELSAVRDELRQSLLDKQAEAEKVESLEDEVEVLQATLDEEAEKSAEEIEVLSKECDDLRRELRDLRRATETARSATDVSRHTADLNAKAIERLERQVDEYRLNLSRATIEKKASDRECDDLRQQLNELRRLTDSAKASTNASREAAEFHAKSISRLEDQVSDYKTKLAQAQMEKRDAQDQLARVKAELHSVTSQLAESEAERDVIDAELQRLKQHDNDTFQIDQERVNLRSAKARLETEIRRLREDNRNLIEQRDTLEKALEEELEKADAEEERLNQEITSLQTKIRQAPDNHEAIKARRTIRDLERKLEDYQHQLAQATMPIEGVDGDSELSLVKRDLTAARKKELDFMQKEGEHKSVIRGLKRQIGDLERRIHEADISRLVQSPGSDTASVRKAEISDLRHQLSVAHQSIADLKKSLRESERRAASMEEEVRQRLDDVEDEKLALEQALQDAQHAAEEANADLTEAVEKYKRRAEKYKKERDATAANLAAVKRSHVHDTISTTVGSTLESEMTREERHDLYEILRKTQIDADALEREVRQHKEALTELAELEKSLRIKLQRARSERAQARSDVEKLQHDMRSLRLEKSDVDKLHRNIKSLKKAKKDAEALAKAAMAQASVARARYTVSTFPSIAEVSARSSLGKERSQTSQPSRSKYQPPRVADVEDDADEEDEEDVVVVNGGGPGAAEDENAARIIHFKDDNDTQMHTETIVRAAQAAEHRHVKQMRDMVMQMEWMQARWERELRMRDDAAFAKQFLVDEMKAKDSVNEADLLKLETFTKQLRLKRSASQPQLSALANTNTRTIARSIITKAGRANLKRFANVVRFVVRLQMMAREWKRQEEIRKMLAEKWGEVAKGRDRFIMPPPANGQLPAVAAAAGPSAVAPGAGASAGDVAAKASHHHMPLRVRNENAAATNVAPAAPSGFRSGGVEPAKRYVQREVVDGETDEVESSVAPLGFDLEGPFDGSSDQGMGGVNGYHNQHHHDNQQRPHQEDDMGTEAFSVDSL